MGRGVPEWMNSSLWSSFDDRHLANHTSSSPSSQPDETDAGSASKQPNPMPNTVRPHDPPPPCKTADQPSPSPSVVASSSSSIGQSSRLVRPADAADSLPPSTEELARRARFIGELSKRVIDLEELRRLAAAGVPDSCRIRPVVWKILLGYLPCNRERWAEELSRKCSQYQVFKEEVLVNPSELTRRLEEFNGLENENSKYEGKCMLPRSNITHGEHPLSLGKASVWNKYFQDFEIVEQIDRDVKRTHPDMHFFSGDSPASKSNQEALKRILVVFAKLNPGIRYVQGMNEILAPIFYIFRTDLDGESEVQAEADSFFCFVELMSGLRDHFCQQLDNSVVGIRSTMTRLIEILRKHDEELWRHLEIITKMTRDLRSFDRLISYSSKVNPQFYAFRWITLLLTQEFNFADSLRIWDMLLSDPDGPLEALLRVCCAMLILIRRRLLAGDFTSNLKLLQHYPSTNIEHLLYVADKLRSQPIVF